MKFVVDVMLGKLAKWLRIIGYDAEYRSSWTDAELRAKALGAFVADPRPLIGGISWTSRWASHREPEPA